MHLALLKIFKNSKNDTLDFSENSEKKKIIHLPLEYSTRK